jgi:hypothetical protein
MNSQTYPRNIENAQTEVQLLHAARAWIRSNQPVKTPRGASNEATEKLGAALAHGVLTVCDLKRRGFFEVTIGDSWFYFHLFDPSGCIYLVASNCR